MVICFLISSESITYYYIWRIILYNIFFKITHYRVFWNSLQMNLNSCVFHFLIHRNVHSIDYMSVDGDTWSRALIREIYRDAVMRYLSVNTFCTKITLFILHFPTFSVVIFICSFTSCCYNCFNYHVLLVIFLCNYIILPVFWVANLKRSVIYLPK